MLQRTREMDQGIYVILVQMANWNLPLGQKPLQLQQDVISCY